MKLRLAHKFALLLMGVAVVPVAVLGVRLLGINREGLQGLVLDYHAQQAQALAQSLETEIGHLLSRVGFLIGSQVVARLPWEDKKALLEEFLHQNADIATVSLISPTGDELVKQYNETLEPNPALVLRAKDAAFLAMRKSKKVEVGTVYFERKAPRINIACPLEQGRALFVVVSLSRLAETVTRTRFRKTGVAILVDRDGRILAHPDPAKVETSAGGLGIIRAGLMGQAAGSQEFVDESGAARVGAFARIPSMGWGVLVQQDRAEAFYTATVIKRQAITAIAVAAVVALLVALYAAGRLARPILEVTGGAERLARGDFTVRVDVRTDDELSQLAKTFNVMVRRLQAYSELQIDRLVVEQNKMEAILFSIEDGILMTDFQGRLLLINEQARTMLRLPASLEPALTTEGAGPSLLEHLGEPGLREAAEAALKSPADWTQELALGEGGYRRVFRARSHLVKSRKGDDLGAVLVIHDVTLEKELEQMKDDFVHSITHDLRNPVGSIQGFTGFLLDESAGPLTDQQRKFLEIISRSSDRLLGLVNDILDVAKMEAGQMTLERAPFDFADVPRRVAEALTGTAMKGHVELVAEGPEAGLPLDGDRGLLERVVQNLIGNALKFTPVGGRVMVKVEDLADRVRVSVADTGEGIPKEYLTKIFDKFQQVGGAKARKGTGLGLTICKWVVEAHGGQIWAESEVGKGSAFIFWVPKTVARQEAVA